MNASFGARLVDGGVGGGFDLQLIGGLDEDESMIGDGLRIASKQISVDVESASHLGRCVKGEAGLPILDVEVACEDRLTVLDDVDISGAAGAGGENFELETVACLEDGAIAAEENLVGTAASLEGYGIRGAVAVVIVGLDPEGFDTGAGVEMNDGHAAGVSGYLLDAITGKMNRECGVGGSAVG